MRLEDALVDLRWIDSLPGTKLLVRGNHDYWWGSASKLAKALPPSIRFIQNNAFHFKGATIGGSRLWDSAEYAFGSFIHFQENPREREPEPSVDGEKIFVRELERLKLSLNQLDPQARLRIAITHYPPIGADLKPSRASDLLERYNVQICVFGHLHSLKKDRPLFGEIRGVRYILASCDYLDFRPIKIADRGATDASPWL
jgi:predicted phosphohydrolase